MYAIRLKRNSFRFIMSEEDKSTTTSSEYWFRVMDRDGDGAITIDDLEFFYAEQVDRMFEAWINHLPFVGNAFTDIGSRALAISWPALPDAGPRKTRPKAHNNAARSQKMSSATHLLWYIPQRRKIPWQVLNYFHDDFTLCKRDFFREQREPFDGNQEWNWARWATEEYSLLVADEDD